MAEFIKLQISNNSGATWSTTSLTASSPLNIGSQPNGTYIRIQSNYDNSLSNTIIAPPVPVGQWTIDSYTFPLLTFHRNYGSSTSVNIQLSTNGGATWSSYNTFAVSPQDLTGMTTGVTHIRLQSVFDSTLSNTIIVPTTTGGQWTIDSYVDPMLTYHKNYFTPTPLATTPVTSLDNIDFVGSPKHLRIDISDNSDIYDMDLRLWIWSGQYDKPSTTNPAHNFLIRKSKVSSSDTFLEVDLAPYIKSMLDPQVSFDNNESIAYGEGVYYQYDYTTFLSNGHIWQSNIAGPTKFATLGYNWNYEGEASASYNYGSFGFVDGEVKKNYYQYINYKDASFNLSGATNSNAMITRTTHIPTTSELVCTAQPVIIVYLNKKGLWDTFSITGKFDISSKVTREIYDRTTRNPISVSRQNFHSSMVNNLNYKESYVLNTGIITEEQGQLIEEIIISKKVYLIIFEKALSQYNAGYTADSTLVTADNAIVTVDNVGTVSTTTKFYQQPVVIAENEFAKKTRAIDKAKISYTLKFESANSKINNLR